MHDLSAQGIAYQSLFLHGLVLDVGSRALIFHCHSEYFVLDGVEAPTGQDHEMPPLRVPAYHSKDGVASVVTDLKLLVDFGVAAAVENCLLCDLSHEAILVFDVNCGPVLWTEAAIVVPDSLVGGVLVVIEASDVPGTMRGGQHESLHKTHLFLQGQIDVSLFPVGLVCGDEFVFVGEVAGHEGESDGEGEGKGVVAIFERVWFLAENEVAVLLEAAPIKYHHSIYQLHTGDAHGHIMDANEAGKIWIIAQGEGLIIRRDNNGKKEQIEITTPQWHHYRCTPSRSCSKSQSQTIHPTQHSHSLSPPNENDATASSPAAQSQPPESSAGFPQLWRAGCRHASSAISGGGNDTGRAFSFSQFWRDDRRPCSCVWRAQSQNRGNF